MEFESIRYMEWFKSRPRVRYDLCRSGVESVPLAEFGLDWSGMELTGENFYGYVPLLREIAGRFGVKEENVVCTLGTSQALFLACAALISPGDRVLVEKPAYEPLVAVPRVFGAEVVRFERRYEEAFGVDIDDLEKKLAVRTRLVILTNLHNPSGSRLPSPAVRDIARICRQAGASVIVDEIYFEFIDGLERRTDFDADNGLVSISSLTKVFGLGGLRCGWALASAELAGRMRRIIDHTNVEGVYIGERIAAALFPSLERVRERSRERVRANLALVRDFFRGRSDISWVEPDGGVVGFPRVEGQLGGDRLAERLVNNFETAVVPGRFFEDPRHFRFSFGGRTDILAAALENIGRALAHQ